MPAQSRDASVSLGIQERLSGGGDALTLKESKFTMWVVWRDSFWLNIVTISIGQGNWGSTSIWFLILKKMNVKRYRFGRRDYTICEKGGLGRYLDIAQPLHLTTLRALGL